MPGGATSKGRCVVCGSSTDVEQNHVGGRNHVAWFTMPFCREHHDQFHALLRASGVDLHYTSDPIERYRRAMQAILLGQWTLTEMLKKENHCETTKTRVVKVEDCPEAAGQNLARFSFAPTLSLIRRKSHSAPRRRNGHRKYSCSTARPRPTRFRALILERTGAASWGRQAISAWRKVSSMLTTLATSAKTVLEPYIADPRNVPERKSRSFRHRCA